MLTPTLFFQLVMELIDAFQVFTAVFVTTDGGPMGATFFYMLYMFRTAFVDFDMGYASALAWIMGALILALHGAGLQELGAVGLLRVGGAGLMARRSLTAPRGLAGRPALVAARGWSALAFLALLVLALVFIGIPVGWTLSTALKQRHEVIAWPPVYWPPEPQWQNFGEVIRRGRPAALRDQLDLHRADHDPRARCSPAASSPSRSRGCASRAGTCCSCCCSRR